MDTSSSTKTFVPLAGIPLMLVLAGALIGGAVAGCGDVGGGGGNDFLVGARFANAPATDAGRAYLFFGGTELDAAADLVLSGEHGDAIFGAALDGAGDVDGDGAMDFAVGSPGFTNGSDEGGRVYVYRGGAALDATADFIFTAAAAGEQFGSAVAGASDLDLNTYDDVLVGAWGAADTGRMYIYGDDTEVDAVPDATTRLLPTFSVTPNPLRTSTGLDLELADDAKVSAAIFDVTGRVVMSWPRLVLAAGRHQWIWSPGENDHLGPGVYYVRLKVDHRTVVRRAVVVR